MDNVATTDQCFYGIGPNTTDWEEKMDTSDNNVTTKTKAITVVNIPPEYRQPVNFDREFHYGLPKWLQINIEYNREEVAHYGNYFPSLDISLFNDISKTFPTKNKKKEEENLKSENEEETNNENKNKMN
uniref:Uncharacterized protein n=1 Tax=Parastrongyloides trichosuri TaxID=131310 RepID=A0A0N4ZBM1_PARTI